MCVWEKGFFYEEQKNVGKSASRALVIHNPVQQKKKKGIYKETKEGLIPGGEEASHLQGPIPFQRMAALEGSQ